MQICTLTFLIILFFSTYIFPPPFFHFFESYDYAYVSFEQSIVLPSWLSNIHFHAFYSIRRKGKEHFLTFQICDFIDLSCLPASQPVRRERNIDGNRDFTAEKNFQIFLKNLTFLESECMSQSRIYKIK